METIKITESFIVEKIKDYLTKGIHGNWHEEKIKISNLHGHGADIIMVGGIKNGERFIIECKGKSYAKSAKTINKENWLNALGQLVTRMNTKRIISNGKNKGNINRSYKYGLGLCKEAAKVALKRIPKEIAKVMNIYIFSCDDMGNIEMFPPSKFN